MKRTPFSTFSSMWSGIGLLALRLAMAVCLAVDGIAGITMGVGAASLGHGAAPWIGGATLLLSGGLTSIGFLTTLAQSLSVLMGLSALAAQALQLDGWFAFTGPWQQSLLEVAAAIVLITIGPGVYSLDSRLFGRREITIPSRTISPDGSSATRASI